MDEKTQFEWGITTLAGARLEVVRHLESAFEVDPAYRKKWRRTKMVARIMGVLAIFDQIRYNGLKDRISIDQAPIFIIGHWRSGTTLMHNMLCELTDAAYCTTYQNVFPNNLFAFYGIIQKVAQFYMPTHRPGDNLKMHTLFPQEEEFALGNVIPQCFYYWMFFPQEMSTLADKYLLIGDHPESNEKRWKDNYLRFIKRCMLRNGGTLFVSKNPPNTLRVDILLELFPNAKFIFLCRDIYDTILSTINFYKGVLPAQQYQKVNDDDLEDQVIEIYDRLHSKYLTDRSKIPASNLVELKLEEVKNSPLDCATHALDQLGMEYTVRKATFEKYQRNEHKEREKIYLDDFIVKVNQRLKPFFTEFDYEMRHVK